LLPDEQLQTLIEEYAGGLTELGLQDRIEVRRSTDDGAARRIDYTNRSERRFELADGDRVVVRSRVETFPIVYVEGALEPPPSEAENADGAEAGQPPETRSRVIRRTLYQGETLLDVLRSIEGRLHSDANLREGLVRRRSSGEDRPVDMEALLYERRTELDIELETNDRIIIPFGIFEVFISGEVTQAGFEDVRSLDRLSRVVGPYMTDYSSRRDVTVRSATGAEQTYDLFRALRYGERDQNPYLQPGDTVIVSRRDRQVQITGEVERPGTYQLLPDEQLQTLIEEYAGGLTSIADPTNVSIVSVAEPSEEEGDDASGFYNRDYNLTTQPAGSVELNDRDRINVPSREEFLPAVFFEGAVRGTLTEDETVATTNATQSDQYRHQFRPGETVADAVRAIRGRFLTTADLSAAFLEREDQQIPIDIAEMLFSDRIPRTPELQRNDRIVIPFRQYFVTVSGAVNSPGQYPYIPDRGYQYYLGLAGGTNPQRHIGENPRIRDVQGDRRPDSATINPEDDIFFRSNNPIYHLSPILGVASTILSTIAIFMSIAN
ncbi:MAG: SLBB domain-containing protein, partial [Alkalispirochaeta sp.]